MLFNNNNNSTSAVSSEESSDSLLRELAVVINDLDNSVTYTLPTNIIITDSNLSYNFVDALPLKSKLDNYNISIYGIDDNKKEVLIKAGAPITQNIYLLPSKYSSFIIKGLIDFRDKDNNNNTSNFSFNVKTGVNTVNFNFKKILSNVTTYKDLFMYMINNIVSLKEEIKHLKLQS
jgi:hypothetical protein